MGMWGLYATEELLAKLNKFDIQGACRDSGSAVSGVYGDLPRSYWVIFNMKYTEGRRKVKKYYNNLKR